MGLFAKRIGPVFLKETSDAVQFIDKMEKLQKEADGEIKSAIEKQISLAKYGEMGEQNIAFELKNSGMDMYILHDIYLQADNLTAQIDYLVITRKRTYVIECKNMIGSIEIDNHGNFIRIYRLSDKWIKEGIYSPITQNARHLQVLKAVRKESKGNFLSKMLFENKFDDKYKPLVVLANSKTFLNAKFAAKEIQDQVIRADQLIARIREMDGQMKGGKMSDRKMRQLADFYLRKNKSERSDYARKYEEVVNQLKSPVSESGNGEKEPANQLIMEPLAGQKDNQTTVSKIRKSLKAYRLACSQKEGIKPYFIFNDAQLDDLLSKKPTTKEELTQISGFGKVKTEKYGDAILTLLDGKEVKTEVVRIENGIQKDKSEESQGLESERLENKKGAVLVAALQGLSSEEYKIVSNISEKDRSLQIDCVVISQYAVFVIKFWDRNGKIAGEEGTQEWVQTVRGNATPFPNPLMQTGNDIKKLAQLLELPENVFAPIAVFPNTATIQVTSNKLVINIEKLKKMISFFSIPKIDKGELERIREMMGVL